jgi:hypothetical protein
MLPPARSTPMVLLDHLGGFSTDLTNLVLGSLPLEQSTVETEYIISSEIANKYPHIKFSLSYDNKKKILDKFADYHVHPDIKFSNFLCSFNGSDHVGRKLLVAILNQFGYFNPKYCSKNFIYNANTLDGHISDFVHERDSFYQKFFVSKDSGEFSQTIYSFGHVRYDHAKNIYNLENKLTQSFLHVVSETIATSYYPFVTEKFLYSIVTRGLFLAYAQPGWHAHVEKYYGFKKYNKLFDYRFDAIQNPVERLVELVTMISKFNMLSADDWRDLYLLEQDTIEYNYNHYFSGDYLKILRQYEQC